MTTSAGHAATGSVADWFFDKHVQWEAPLRRLRDMLHDAGLTEELKWGCPCYTLRGKNVALLHVFKDYCALLLFKGVLLKDPQRMLVQQTKNVQAARQIRFTSVDDVLQRAAGVRACLLDAIAVERSGAPVPFKETVQFDLPAEFASKLHALPALQTAFNQLTPGRQRAYLLHFASAKQSKTRAARVEQSVARILAGKGLDDAWPGAT